MYKCGKHKSCKKTWVIYHLSCKVLQWLSEEGEIIVNKQVLIAFSIGKYKDKVFVEPCDVQVLKNPNPLKDVEASALLDVAVLV